MAIAAGLLDRRRERGHDSLASVGTICRRAMSPSRAELVGQVHGAAG